MILILSTSDDYDTQRVIDWLQFKKAKFFRLNDEDLMTGKVIFQFGSNDQDSFIKSYCGKKIYFHEIKCVWLRKFGFLRIYHSEFEDGNQFMNYLYSEFSYLRKLIFRLLNNKKWLFDRKNMKSKLEVLEFALESGLQVPNFIITSSKKVLQSFLEKNNHTIINKSIGEGKNIVFKNKSYPFYTHLIKNIENVTDTFSPSFFQAYIEKEIELRVFFIEDKFYSMAIFSQNNPKTKIDFRNYDIKRPNRLCSFRLPRDIELKLNRLMIKLRLNTGSIDLIKAKDGKYYFLEVNPSGQFGMTGLPCNYCLEEKIANFLIREDNE